MFLKAPAGAFLLPFSCVSTINLHEFFQLKNCRGLEITGFFSKRYNVTVRAK
jgi:hypothetical protein